ncbi:hypothetical protein HDV04_005073 [Boothiomyces sp. JEL0838]|nr:hypothetical protein HDV04_005073 [Boothiomyces sp. JEL0838]
MFNWAKSVQLCQTNQVVKVKNVEQLRDILIHVNSTGKHLKIMGTGMSFGGIGATDSSSDVMVDMSNLSGLIKLDGNLAKFGGSTVLQVVTDTLVEHNLQIAACPGVLVAQTLAGALATGTHGQGLKNGGLYDIVYSMDVMFADGTLHTLSRDSPYYNGKDVFHAFQLHLGCLGVVVAVTLECEPLQIYRLDKSVTDFEDLKENYIKWNNENEHCKAWWFPNTNHVQVWKTNVASAKEVLQYKENGNKIYDLKEEPVAGGSTYGSVNDKPLVGDLKGSGFSSSLQELLSNMALDTSTDSKGKTKDLNEARFRTVQRFSKLDARVGNIYQIWCKGIPAPQINCELAVPLDRLPELLQTLRDFYESTDKSIHYPFILRTGGPSPSWLSPSYNQKVCYIGFLAYLNEKTFTVHEDQMEFVCRIEKVIADFGCWPHYGKFFTRSLYSFESMLPRFKEFAQLRQTVDPNNVFANQFIRDLLSI